MDNDQEEKPDISAHLNEGELLKPGTTVHPGQETTQGAQNKPNPHNPSQPTDHFHDDLDEIKTFNQEQNQEEEPEPKHGFWKVIWEITKTLLIAAAVVIIINTFLFQAYYVSGNSMNPDFKDGDYLLINKIPITLQSIEKFFGSKGNTDIKRGDVAIFRPPESPQLFFIKRVIGLPGDRVVVKDGKVTVYTKDNPNGMTLDETYIDPAYKTEGDIDTVVEPNKLFVMGDNRSPGGSYDSRAWGQLPQENLSGIAFFRLIPLSALGFISNPLNK